MQNKLFAFLAFAAGAAIGSVVTWKLVKSKYEQIAQEEIDSVKEVFSRRHRETEDTNEEAPRRPHVEEKPDLAEYVTMLNRCKYLAEHPEEADGEEGASASSVEPYVISPDEFGDQEGYETTSLTYYADNVLADEFDEVIDNFEELIGTESLKHFGEYEADAVHVRNDATKTDYEILLDIRNYDDVPRTKAFDYNLVDEE